MRTGAEAYAWAVTQPSWPHAMCLNFVWNAFGSPATGGGFPDANSSWNRSGQQHPGDRHPPQGAPLHFTGPDGHVMIAEGGGGETAWSTDVAGYGLNGFTTISAIE